MRNKLILSQLHSCSLFIESLFSQLFSHHSERPYYHSERFARCHSEASPELVEGRSEESIEAPYGSCNTQEVHSVRLTGVGAQLPLVLHCPSVATSQTAQSPALTTCGGFSATLVAGHAVAVIPLSALQSNNLNPVLALWDSCLNVEKKVGGLAATYSIVISYLNKILRDKIGLTYRKSAHLAVICGRLFSAFRHFSSSISTRFLSLFHILGCNVSGFFGALLFVHQRPFSFPTTFISEIISNKINIYESKRKKIQKQEEAAFAFLARYSLASSSLCGRLIFSRLQPRFA